MNVGFFLMWLCRHHRCFVNRVTIVLLDHNYQLLAQLVLTTRCLGKQRWLPAFLAQQAIIAGAQRRHEAQFALRVVIAALVYLQQLSAQLARMVARVGKV
ncbi:hypothetical protein EON62_01770 [archaeon]|nr:MAG: hypothetical protein EON62_01770 [archaeon]